MAEDNGDLPSTALVVVTTDAATTAELARWITGQLPERHLAVGRGYYGGISAIGRGVPVVLIDLGVPAGRDSWRLAELRTRAAAAAVVVVADASLVPGLAAPLRADLVATTVADLPPLRELLVSADSPVPSDQTMRRRSSR